MSDIVERLTADGQSQMEREARIILSRLLREARDEIKRLREEIHSLEHSFQMQWYCGMQAIRLWQEKNPGNDLVWPDETCLLVWLMEQHENQKQQIKRLEATLNMTEN